MLWVWLLLSAFCVLIFIIFISKLRIQVNVNRVRGNDFYQIKCSLWFGLIRYTYKIPVIKVDEDSPTVVVDEEMKAGNPSQEKGGQDQWKDYSIQDAARLIEDMKEFLEHVVGFHKIVKRFLSHVSIERIRWNTVIGSGDAMYTGVTVGMIWSLKGSLIGIVSQYMRLKDHPIIEVLPSFQYHTLETRFQCMISFRIGHAILTSLRILKHWKKFRHKRTERLGNVQSEKVHSVKM
ncbi:DUF2953 domain-containing protein [Priestia abyssalis]|uniref:DUF2953 domain-containing protein n=1 Tax=Priestia abyssalis TaxID=1221450 RepID=UPI00099548F0|nr:DUF2953 domain-containing protein [Priestia abyssalis]